MTIPHTTGTDLYAEISAPGKRPGTKKEHPKIINWLECTLEDKIPEYKEWITARRFEEAEGLEQERKIA
ncbi:MAG: hypothetical protein Q3M24_22875 [Candidatus Electrothrix aestuarii]|uniref:Uncharacterized protein n=1 Tax=Candidatus Electrothrix aestuarii TaxID=3062594 RepID=A0AAU8LW71_9BACT|nr:hypothetical protein [Candidatus Electrothrix aestuarii]